MEGHGQGPGTVSQFSVCWREYRGTVCTGLGALLRDQELVDVTLAAGGHMLQAHRAVLSVCSPYFRRMFQTSPCHHPIVVLQDVSYQSMKDLLQFMYNGEVSIKQEDLTSFISTAETLEIKGLSNKKKTEESEEEMNVPSSTFPSNSYYDEEPEESNNVVSNSYGTPSPTRVPIQPVHKINRHMKRKPESRSVNENSADSADFPEKRIKLREKQILNKHKLNSIRNPISVKPFEALKAPDAVPIPAVTREEDNQTDAINLSENNDSHDNFDNHKADSVPDIKSESDTDYPGEKTIVNGNRNDKYGEMNLTTSPKADDVSDIAAFYSEMQRLSWPIATSLLPSAAAVKSAERHTIVTIPQKEDGKKKYPQRSCRFCWRAGKRRDTRFMCAQCCVPLCKSVCFEQHQSQVDGYNLDSNGVV